MNILIIKFYPFYLYKAINLFTLHENNDFRSISGVIIILLMKKKQQKEVDIENEDEFSLEEEEEL